MRESVDTSRKDTAHITAAIHQKQLKGSVDLLTALGVTCLQDFDVTSTSAVLIFQQNTAAQVSSFPQLVEQLQFCFEKQNTLLPKNIEPETFFGFTLRMLKACGGVDIAKQASLHVFEIVKDKLSFKIEKGILKVRFSKDIAAFFTPLFKGVNAAFFSADDNGLQINLKKCFELRYFDILWLQDEGFQKVFLSTHLVSPQKVFFISEALEDGKTKVTPIFRTDSSRKTPTYQIILDVSKSMNTEGHISKAKKSVLALAQLIFDQYPDARLQVNTFADRLWPLVSFHKGAYTQKDLPALEEHLMLQRAHGDSTALYETTLSVWQQYFLIKKTGVNTLLLTDGINNDHSERRLKNELDLQARNRKLRPEKSTNKLSVISFGVEQPELMKSVCEFLNSSVITLSDAEFASDATISQFLMKFVHYRELLLVNNRVLVDTEEHISQEEIELSSNSHQIECELDGGLVQAESQILEPGTQLVYKVTDSQGHVFSCGAMTVRKMPHELILSSSSSRTLMHGASPNRVFSLPSTSGNTQMPPVVDTKALRLSTV
jgi:hypothetical protein